MTGQNSTKSNRLQGKVAIVTGGASGIGEATVHNFANHGAHAIVIADLQDDKGQKLAETIGLDRCIYIHCDVSNEEDVKFLVKSTVEKYGHLDIMFSNAGIGSKSNQTILEFDLSEEAFGKLFAVNVKGMAACVKHAAKAMVDGGVSGSIICTTSVVGTRGFDVFTDYVMSKHAIIGLVRSASLQLGSHGIRVNSITPGVVGTPLLCSHLGLDKESEDKLVEKSSGLKGILRAKHLADAVVFLASEEAEFVTGVDLVVDGGYVPLPLV